MSETDGIDSRALSVFVLGLIVGYLVWSKPSTPVLVAIPPNAPCKGCKDKTAARDVPDAEPYMGPG